MPALLATSFNRATALAFKDTAVASGYHGVVWKVRLMDPDKDRTEPGGGGCMQVNFLDKSLLRDESEFLFAAYSAFRVLAVDTSNPGAECLSVACVCSRP